MISHIGCFNWKATNQSRLIACLQASAEDFKDVLSWQIQDSLITQAATRINSDIGALFRYVHLLRHVNLVRMFVYGRKKNEKQQRTCAQIKSCVCLSKWLLLVILSFSFFFFPFGMFLHSVELLY